MIDLLIACLAWQAVHQVQPPPIGSTTLDVALSDTLRPGHGPSARVTHEVDFGGTLHAWVEAGSFDPCLAAEDELGEVLAEDEDSGGGRVPHLRLEVLPGRRITFCVAAHGATAPAMLRLHLSPAPETDGTLAAALAAGRSIHDIHSLSKEGKADRALELTIRALDEVLSAEGAEESERTADVLATLGYFAGEFGDLQASLRAREIESRHRERTLPPDHAVRQRALGNEAWCRSMLGDLAGARSIQEQVYESFSRTLAPEDHRLINARSSLAESNRLLGDLDVARRLHEENVEAAELGLPEDHPLLQRARMGLAGSLKAAGEVAEARVLMEKALASSSRSLPADHPDLLFAKLTLAGACLAGGDYEAARRVASEALEGMERVLPPDHHHIASARGMLAFALFKLGELTEARAAFELVLAQALRTLPETHSEVQEARSGLALALKYLGDVEGARALEEQVLAVRARTLPDDHAALQHARGNLAQTLRDQGDYEGARVLEEQVLEVFSRSRPDEDGDLQLARMNLGATLSLTGDVARSRELLAKVCEVRQRTLPPGHPDVQVARGNLALVLEGAGDFAAAGEIYDDMLGAYSLVLPPDNPDVVKAVQSVARMRTQAGRLEEALELRRDALARLESSQPADSLDVIGARRDLAWISAALSRNEEALGLATDVGRALQAALLAAAPALSSREAEEWVAARETVLSDLLSLTCPTGGPARSEELDRACFSLVELMRGIGLLVPRALGEARGAEDFEHLRAELRVASDRIVTSASDGDRRALAAAVRARDRVQRQLLAHAATSDAVKSLAARIDPQRIALALAPDEAAISYWRYARSTPGPGPGARDATVPSLLAFVVRGRAPVETADGQDPESTAAEWLTRVELGPIEAVERAVEAWRAGIVAPLDGRAPAGVFVGDAPVQRSSLADERLRELVFDPLRPWLAGVRTLSVASDDALHLIPLDALSDGDALLGEHFRIHCQPVLWSRLAARPEPAGPLRLVALGGIDYGGAGIESSRGSGPREPASAPASTSARFFTPLPATAREVEALGDCARSATSVEPCLLRGVEATREALIGQAPQARFLHLATHGYFAPELFPMAEAALSHDLERSVSSLSPLVRCGLALAGANAPRNALGQRPGVFTAEELASLDLSNCELAVLSACDTNVGLRRAGQGVASLQKALHMAGARSVITSLWKVPDEATKELMLDFYRRLWVEKKPQDHALWEAKMKLRDARDEHDQALYSTRDWAAWVLTGESR